jgi:hypothetical protein
MDGEGDIIAAWIGVGWQNGYDTLTGTTTPASTAIFARIIAANPSNYLTTSAADVEVPGGTAQAANIQPGPAANPVSVSNNGGTGTVTPGMPTITIADATPTLEGNAASSNKLVFTVTLSSAYTSAITVSYSTADGSGKAGTDYTAVSGTLTFAKGQTSQTISVPIIGKSVNQNNETVLVNLKSPTNATLARATATGTMVNNVPAPTMTINNVTIVQGGKAVFLVSLSAKSGKTITVSYSTKDGTAKASGKDYTATSGKLTFLPGQTSQTITVNLGTTVLTSNKTFAVVLGSAANATLTRTVATGTIIPASKAATTAAASTTKSVMQTAAQDESSGVNTGTPIAVSVLTTQGVVTPILSTVAVTTQSVVTPVISTTAIAAKSVPVLVPPVTSVAPQILASSAAQSTATPSGSTSVATTASKTGTTTASPAVATTPAPTTTATIGVATAPAATTTGSVTKPVTASVAPVTTAAMSVQAATAAVLIAPNSTATTAKTAWLTTTPVVPSTNTTQVSVAAAVDLILAGTK